MKDVRGHLGGVLKQCTAALRSAALYPIGHPAIQEPLGHLADDLKQLLEARERLILGVIDDVLVLDEIPFYDADVRYNALYVGLTTHELEAVSFRPGLTRGELETFLDLLAPGRSHGDQPLHEVIQGLELPHIALRYTPRDDDPRAQAQRTYEHTLGIVLDLTAEIRLGRIPNSQTTPSVLGAMRNLILADESALLGLTLLKDYDNYTYNHSVNVAIFALAFARHMGNQGVALERAGMAALLHDVGKVRTAEAIIKKPGALDPEEIKAMQRHPELGAEILLAMRGMDAEIAEIVLHHHRRYDGAGYPELPPGRAPHPYGEVVAIADCYDALTTTRPYQKSLHPSEAARALRRQAGKAYAPESVQSFVDMVGIYPIGEPVRLSTGELSVVIGRNDLDPTAPRVRIVSDAQGQLLDRAIDCDLQFESVAGRVIAGSFDARRKGIDLLKVLEV